MEGRNADYRLPLDSDQKNSGFHGRSLQRHAEGLAGSKVCKVAPEVQPSRNTECRIWGELEKGVLGARRWLDYDVAGQEKKLPLHQYPEGAVEGARQNGSKVHFRHFEVPQLG